MITFCSCRIDFSRYGFPVYICKMIQIVHGSLELKEKYLLQPAQIKTVVCRTR